MMALPSPAANAAKMNREALLHFGWKKSRQLLGTSGSRRTAALVFRLGTVRRPNL